MDATEFRNDDRAYFAWLVDHPHGFVLNRRKGRTADYLVLHRAGCWQIAMGRDSLYAYTGGRLIKVCADWIEPLEAHATREGGSLTRCRVCNP